MSLVHLHLMINHLPVIIVPLAGALLAWGMYRDERVVSRAALVMLVFAAIMTVPVFLTGEPAEEGVEQLPGIVEAVIERHEDVAPLALAATGLVGVLALVGLLLSRNGRSAPRGLGYTVLAAVVIAIGALSATAYLGGMIRHSELQPAGLLSQGLEHR
jgi:hypothetical protein